MARFVEHLCGSWPKLPYVNVPLGDAQLPDSRSACRHTRRGLPLQRPELHPARQDSRNGIRAPGFRRDTPPLHPAAGIGEHASRALAGDSASDARVCRQGQPVWRRPDVGRRQAPAEPAIRVGGRWIRVYRSRSGAVDGGNVPPCCAVDRTMARDGTDSRCTGTRPWNAVWIRARCGGYTRWAQLRTWRFLSRVCLVDAMLSRSCQRSSRCCESSSTISLPRVGERRSVPFNALDAGLLDVRQVRERRVARRGPTATCITDRLTQGSGRHARAGSARIAPLAQHG